MVAALADDPSEAEAWDVSEARGPTPSVELDLDGVTWASGTVHGDPGGGSTCSATCCRSPSLALTPSE